MENGVAGVKLELIKASAFVTEQFQAGKDALVEGGFESLRSMNSRLLAITEKILAINISMGLAVTMVNNRIDEANECHETHTQCADVMRLISELSRDISDFTVVD